MNINTAFPSKWLKAGVEITQDTTATMGDARMEKVGPRDDLLPVLYFQGKDKGLVLNKTNFGTIASAYGAETSGWAGKTITMYSTETDYNGEMMACIRIRKIPTLPSAAPSNLQEVTDEHGTPPDTSDIPF